MTPKNEACDNCRYFRRLEFAEVDAGECRRRSPGLASSNHNGWPRLLPSEWCGEWEERGDASIDDIRSARDMLTAELKRRREAGYVERVGCSVDYRPGRHGKL